MSAKQKYYKKNGIVLKVLEYDEQRPGFFYSTETQSDNIHLISDFEPATEDEYKEFKKQLKKKM